MFTTIFINAFVYMARNSEYDELPFLIAAIYAVGFGFSVAQDIYITRLLMHIA